MRKILSVNPSSGNGEESQVSSTRILTDLVKSLDFDPRSHLSSLLLTWALRSQHMTFRGT